MGLFVFDGKKVNFREVERTFRGIVSLVVKYFFLSLVLASIYYAIFALFISTDPEKRLHQENKMYGKVYPEMREREKLVADVIDGLQLKDNDIYKKIFYSDAPGIDPVTETDLLAVSDTIPDRDIVRYTYLKSDALLQVADKVEADLSGIVARYAAARDSLPPLTLPLDDVSYVQVGASTGERINPFFKVPMTHDGVDIIAPQGSPVLAVAAGRVTGVERSRKGRGNVVEITHQGGYVTRYCHLGDISVSKGQMVRKGAKIGEIGLSGSSFAPHLHYEVMKDSTHVDPVQHFFASVTPYEYANMVYMSVNTGQSMD